MMAGLKLPQGYCLGDLSSMGSDLMRRVSIVALDEIDEAAYGQSVFQRVKESGPIGMAAIAAVLLAVILILGAPYLAANRKQLILMMSAAVFLGVSGYVVYDREYLLLSLYVSDAENLRADCRKLLQLRASSSNAGTSMITEVNAPNLPPSFVRCGAQWAIVNDRAVWIGLRTQGCCGAWGILYDPDHVSRVYLPGARPTWHRDFYEFRR